MQEIDKKSKWAFDPMGYRLTQEEQKKKMEVTE